MTTTAHIPSPYEIRTLLEDLFGRSVAVKPGPPWAPLNGEPGTVGLFVDDRFVIRALGVCDLRFSAYAAAAIGLVPRAEPHRWIKRRLLDRDTEENLDEVLDICAGLYNVEGAPPMRLLRVHHIGSDVAPRVSAMSAAVGRRVDLMVDITGYGTGRLSFVTVA